MHKYRLKDFEFSINPATWNIAQDLVAAGAVRSLREVEKHFWVALVETEEGRYEVEAMLSPTRIKAYTCECWQEGRRLMCPHVAAALLKIRQFLAQQTEERIQKVEKRRQASNTRLTVQHILQDVEAADLQAFVRAYARRDRDFALALKTWFAATVSGPENAFLLVLEAAIPRAAVQGNLRENELRRLRKMLEDLVLQLQTATEEGHAQTGYQIAAAMLEKIGPLLPKFNETRRGQLLHFCHIALQQLDLLAKGQISPELRENVWTTLLQWVNAPWFPTELHTALVRTAGRESNVGGHFAMLQDLFDRTPAPTPPLVLHLYLAALAERGMQEATVRVLEGFGGNTMELMETIRLLHRLNYQQAAKLAAGYLLDHGDLKLLQRRELEDLLLQLAEQDKDKERLLALLRRRFLEQGKPEIFNRLRATAGAGWPAVLQELMQELVHRGDQQRIAIILAAEGELQALADLLETIPDLQLLATYEHLLDDAFLQRRYTTLLSEYLQDHFGLPASAYVRTALGGLVRHGRNELAMNIILDLVGRFDDRPSLAEELSELFPKAKRKLERSDSGNFPAL